MGEGEIAEKQCPECMGQRMYSPSSCPHTVNTGTCDKAFEAYAIWKNENMPPIIGGSQDQAKSFLQMVKFLDSVIYKWNDLEKEKEERFAKMRR